jgi:hypothetical protein
MAGLIRDAESKSALIPSIRMIRSSSAILDGSGSIDPCFDSQRVFFPLSIITFNREPYVLRMPSIGTHTGSVSTIVAPGRFGRPLQVAGWGAAGEQEVLTMGGYDR